MSYFVVLHHYTIFEASQLLGTLKALKMWDNRNANTPVHINYSMSNQFNLTQIDSCMD